MWGFVPVKKSCRCGLFGLNWYSVRKKGYYMKQNALPELNMAQQEELLSTPHNQMVVYNHLTNSFNRNHYAGYPVYWFAGEHIAHNAKQKLDKELAQSGRQVVASAMKGVPEMSWNGDLEFIQYPLAEKFAENIAGNVIVFNKQTGLYEVLPAGQWLGVDTRANSLVHRPVTWNNQHTGLHTFLLTMQQNKKALDKIVAEFTKSRSK